MLDTSKVRTYTPRSYPQDSAGQASHISTQFGQVSDALLSLKEHADEVDNAANAVEARVTTAESNLSALDAREAADKAELDADVATLTSDLASEASTRGSADTALDGRVTTIEGAYAHKGANTDITSMSILLVDGIPLIADYPDDRTITFRTFPMDVTVTKLDAICGVGNTTLQLKKNGSNMGSSINPSTTGANTTYSSGNTFTAGTDVLSIVRSSTSSDCEALSGMIHIKRPIP